MVMDASVAIDRTLGQVHPGIEEAVTTATVIVAPTLFAAEVTNALWKHVRAGDIDLANAQALIDATLDMCDQFIPLDDATLHDALYEARRLNHPVYDMIYAVLARRESAVLATVDRRLAAIARDLGIDVLGA
jgi:predicted nucleic acid-binding protein